MYTVKKTSGGKQALTTIATPTATRSSSQEPDCYDCFSQSLRDTDLCRPSLAILPISSKSEPRKADVSVARRVIGYTPETEATLKQEIASQGRVLFFCGRSQNRAGHLTRPARVAAVSAGTQGVGIRRAQPLGTAPAAPRSSSQFSDCARPSATSQFHFGLGSFSPEARSHGLSALR